MRRVSLRPHAGGVAVVVLCVCVCVCMCVCVCVCEYVSMGVKVRQSNCGSMGVWEYGSMGAQVCIP
jgi:hypothetical protein